MLHLVADQRDTALTETQQQEITALLSQKNGKAVYLYKQVIESGEMRIVLIPSDLAMQEVMQMLNGSITVLTSTNEQVRTEAQETVRVIKEDCQRTINEQAQTITELRARIAQLEGLQAQMTTTYQEKLQAITDAAEQRKNALEAQMKQIEASTKSSGMIDGLINHTNSMLNSTRGMLNTVINPYPQGGHRRDALERFIAETTKQNYNSVINSLTVAVDGLVKLKAEINN